MKKQENFQPRSTQIPTNASEKGGLAAPSSVPENTEMSPKPNGKFGAGGPPGNKKALRHGAYSARLSAQEQEERGQFERELMADLSGDVSTAQKALIRRAGFLEIRLRRCEGADAEGLRIADEHLLSWINSQRLLLSALGLERRKKNAPSLQDYLAQKDQQAEKCQ